MAHWRLRWLTLESPQLRADGVGGGSVGGREGSGRGCQEVVGGGVLREGADRREAV